MRWLDDPEPVTAAVRIEVPDAVAVHDEDGVLVGWDYALPHIFLTELGHRPADCDEDCVARGHVDSW